MCDWVSLLYSRKFREYCKPAIMEKIKIIKKKNKYIYFLEFPFVTYPFFKPRTR